MGATKASSQRPWFVSLARRLIIPRVCCRFISLLEGCTITVLMIRANSGMDWVGILVERISGVSLGEYFSKNIFLPLGVDDIAFDVSEAMRSRLLGMHARSADGVLTARG